MWRQLTRREATAVRDILGDEEDGLDGHTDGISDGTEDEAEETTLVGLSDGECDGSSLGLVDGAAVHTCGLLLGTTDGNN